MIGFLLCGGWLITVAAAIYAIGWVDQRRRAAEDAADDAEDRAQHWHGEARTYKAVARLHEAANDLMRADLAHSRRTIAAVLEHGEKRRIAAVDAVLDELGPRRAKKRGA